MEEVVKDGLQDIYAQMMLTSQALQRDDGYRTNPYQVYLAAKLVSSKSNWTVLQLGPGQGKTFIMFLMAMHFCIHRTYKNAVIFTTEEVLANQLRMNKEKHCHENYPEFIQVVTGPNFKVAASMYPDSVFFVDEGDVFIRDHLCHLGPDKTLDGLVSLKARTFIFSATIARDLQEVIKTIYPTAGALSFINALPSLYYT